VEPRALSWPAALAGPGVSKPTATTSDKESPAFSVAILRPSATLLEADLWSLLRKGGMLAQSLDEKLLLPVHKRILYGSSAKIPLRPLLARFSPLVFDAHSAQLGRIETIGLRGRSLMWADVSGGGRNLAESCQHGLTDGSREQHCHRPVAAYPDTSQLWKSCRQYTRNRVSG
jgi:hypothetical protein